MEDQIAQLKQKLEARQTQFQNYKKECKQLQQYLQAQSEKKDNQIRKIKQQAIKKEKNYANIKTQCSQYQSEIALLKQQLAQANSKDPQKTDSNNQFQAQIDQLREKLQNKQQDLKESQLLLNQFKNKIATFQNQQQKLKSKIISLQQQLSKQRKVSSQKSSPLTTTVNNDKSAAQKQVQIVYKQNTEKVSQLQDTISKLEAQIGNLKDKCHKFKAQKGELSNKLKQLELSSSQKKEYSSPIKNQSPKYQQQDEIMMEQNNFYSSQSSLWKSSLILTKKHYMSPFLQLRNANQLKLYKSNKNGFQKSLGAKKFKMDLITYQMDTLIEKITDNIKGLNSQSIQDCPSESIFIVGAKKSSKKYLMAGIINAIKDKILQLAEQRQSQIEVTFMKRSIQQEKNYSVKSSDQQGITNILQTVLKMGSKNTAPSVSKIGKKNTSKPKIRYFSVRIGQYILEILTTSHTQIPIKDGSSLSDALNQTVYTKSGDLLQVANSNKQIILTLNPIVQNYQDCKNCLVLSNCKQQVKNYNDPSAESQIQNSPIKEELFLNDTVKKKFDAMKKQGQQQSLKIRRLQEDAQFYRAKFDDLQFRLKGLLNTHNRQNSYLKKSPTTLSYEKLLKFVHSVLARNPNPFTHEKVERSQVNELPQKTVNAITIQNHFDTDDEPI